ncbi:MAG: ribosome maturation factor RimP [Actinomycetota bacterium]|jgi:ribosome maturation factor RimP
MAGFRESLRELVCQAAEGLGVEVLDVELARSGRTRALRVVIDRDEGVDLDTITQVSEVLSRALDRENSIPERYVLEVSSPGIDRPLRTQRDFRRQAGRMARVRTVEGFAGPREMDGEIVRGQDDAVVLKVAGEEILVPYEQVASAKVILPW